MRTRAEQDRGAVRRWQRLTIVALGLAAAVSAGCAEMGMQPSATVTTTTPGVTERWFKLDWTVEQAGANEARLDGYVENVSGRPVSDVQLLFQSLDSMGNLVDQRRQWLPGGLPNGARQFFVAYRLPSADQYRVSVWSYSAVESSGGRDR